MKNFLLTSLIALGSSLAQPLWAVTAEDYYKAGLALYQQQQYDKAVQYFKAAAQLDPSDWKSYQLMGYAYYSQKNNREALNAFDQSLKINTDNPTLSRFVQTLRSQAPLPSPGEAQTNSLSFPATVSDSATPAPTPDLGQTPAINKHLVKNHVFLKSEYGFGIVSFGDLPQAMQAYTLMRANGNLDQPHNVLVADSEIGYSWNPYNAVGLSSYDIFVNGPFYADTYSSGATVTDNIQEVTDIQLLSVGLDYSHFIPDKGGRWFGKISAGYYLASLLYSEVVYTYVSATGKTTFLSNVSSIFSGGAFGGSLELGREFHWFWIIGFDFSVKGTYANVGQLTSGTGALAVLSDGTIGVLPSQQVGQNGSRYANIDFSGIQAKVGLTAYF